MSTMESFLNLDKPMLLAWLAQNGQAAYRAGQIFHWVYGQGISDWQQMTNLSQPLRAKCQEQFSLRCGRIERRQHSRDGTRKWLLAWPDGARTETVLIVDGQRRTVCLSTQVGCPVGCVFCASGQGGLERSLATGEIVEQFLQVRQELQPEERISNVVVMGMGEPLANYENTLHAIRIINADWAFGIGARHITLSTIGLPKQIRRLAHEDLQITLAVSLHAADDSLRQRLIPWAARYPLEEIFAAIDYYFGQTGREVTLEYILLRDVNCSTADADRLASWARRSRCNVNLIAYNAVADSGFAAASAETAERFAQRLKARGVNVHLRRSRGGDIDAACGQLRRKAAH
ncbi:MAG: 23S rRNA (adenine(2503)-C(2))-methyltransferase RlmN [Sedimentisphaerales bacterium]|nr:23S rRNA (adenine(2503)-C(2))-methyltransferase RlmN [Sedimentisphaerales bacterium]